MGPRSFIISCGLVAASVMARAQTLDDYLGTPQGGLQVKCRGNDSTARAVGMHYFFNKELNFSERDSNYQPIFDMIEIDVERDMLFYTDSTEINTDPWGDLYAWNKGPVENIVYDMENVAEYRALVSVFTKTADTMCRVNGTDNSSTFFKRDMVGILHPLSVAAKKIQDKLGYR